MSRDTRTRRSMIVGLGAAMAATAAGARTANAQTVPAGGFRPARHELDSWMDGLPGKHRIFIDAATTHGGAEAVLFANNLYTANKAAYSLADNDLAMVICMRHFATPFAYTDAIWAKYGKAFSDMVQFTDPKTHQAPSTNLLNSTAYGMTLPNLGSTIDQQTARGTRYAVCDAATHFFAAQLAAMKLGAEDAIYKELVAGIIPNARMVSAGVVAVTRSQEYGYSLLYAG
jgi:hypothetical protein